MTSLGDRLGDKLGSYSKGMTRKLLLARTLMTQPRLAILDEPTSGLDVLNALEVRDTVKRQAADGTAVLLSSHNMLEIEYLSDRVALINKGRDRRHRNPRSAQRTILRGQPGRGLRGGGAPMRKFWVLLKKELRELLTLQMLLPFVIIILMFVAIGNIVADQGEQAQAAQQVGVVDLDGSDLSAAVIASVESADFEAVSVSATDGDELIEELKAVEHPARDNHPGRFCRERHRRRTARDSDLRGHQGVLRHRRRRITGTRCCAPMPPTMA